VENPTTGAVLVPPPVAALVAVLSYLPICSL
jgi:hypothetical protein